MSLLPAKAADKSVDCVNEVLFGTCSKDCKDVCLVVSVEEIGGEPAEATPDNSEDSTQPLDAFFANVLSAAAKDDAPCDWLASTIFGVDDLNVLVGIGVSQCLALEACPLIQGLFNEGREGFMNGDDAKVGVVGWSFVEFAHVGVPVTNKRVS